MTNGPVILPYRGQMPKIDPTAFVAPGAIVIGDVTIGPKSSIWFGCVLRGDVNYIRIGAGTNIQDGTIIHTASAEHGAPRPTEIGDDVTVGHMALIHAATIASGGFVGMKAAMLDGSLVETGGMLAAGALLTPNKIVPSGQIWAGNPAKYWREIRPEEVKLFNIRAAQYALLGDEYLVNLRR
jgi:gamma-carbonic anhydrase